MLKFQLIVMISTEQGDRRLEGGGDQAKGSVAEREGADQ